MADTVSVTYLYPPNMLDGNWDEKQGNRRVVVKLAGVSDGTGETDVKKIDLSDLKTHAGNVPGRTVAEKIEWQVTGMTCVLEWDRTPQAIIYVINADGVQSSGSKDWTSFGGILDPGDDDGTGDILLTTSAVTAGDSYTIILTLRLKD